MTKMATAEEYLASKQYDWAEDINTTECMIEFAKMHVAAALKAVAKECDNEIEKDFINEELILNSYSLENIK